MNSEYSNFSNSWIDSDNSVLLHHSNNSTFDEIEDDVLLLDDNYDTLPPTSTVATSIPITTECNSTKDRCNKHEREILHVQQKQHEKKKLKI